jgi:hypothetical protein
VLSRSPHTCTTEEKGISRGCHTYYAYACSKRDVDTGPKMNTGGFLRTLRLAPPQAVHPLTCSDEQHVTSCRVADPALAPVALWSPALPLITLYESHAVAAVGGNVATGGNVGCIVGAAVGCVHGLLAMQTGSSCKRHEHMYPRSDELALVCEIAPIESSSKYP